MAGAVRPGNANMAAGGMEAGGNQENMKIIDHISLVTNDRKYTYDREPSYSMYVYLDGKLNVADPKYNNIEENVTVKDYDGGGFFKKGAKVSVLSVYTNLIPIIIPVTLHMKGYDEVDGTVAVYFRCNLDQPKKLVSLLAMRDFVKEEQKGLELHKTITADKLAMIFQNDISSDAGTPVSQVETSYDVAESLRSYLFDSMDMDVVFSERGFSLVKAYARFEGSSMEKLMKRKLDGKIALEDKMIKHNDKMLSIELADREFDDFLGE